MMSVGNGPRELRPSIFGRAMTLCWMLNMSALGRAPAISVAKETRRCRQSVAPFFPHHGSHVRHHTCPPQHGLRQSFRTGGARSGSRNG